MLISRILPWLLSHSGKPFALSAADGTDAWPMQLPETPFGLYVHIPFCRQLCAFCPYCKQLYREDQAARYVEALLQEVDLFARQSGLKGGRIPVTDLYFGGGTPALLAGDLTRLIDRLRECFDIRGGIGIELHPDDIDEAMLNTLAQAGFSMVSIGVQSFNGPTLARLQRRPADLTTRMEQVRNAGFKVIDIDLIFGIRGQTDDSLEADIRQAFAFGATQVSAYPLITFSYTKSSCRPAGSRRRRRLLAVLEKAGGQLALERTAVWTFNRPGSQPYTSVTRPAYLGFGVSAVSMMGQTLTVNTFSVDEYCSRLLDGHPAAVLKMTFLPRQLALYVLFWQAYRLRLDAAEFRIRTGQDLETALKWELLLARLAGWVRRLPDGSGYRLTRRGCNLYHEAEQAVTHRFLDPLWRQAGRQPAPPDMTLQ